MTTINVISIAAFCRRNLPSMFHSMPRGSKRREDTTNWLSWHMRGREICCIMENGKIEAVGVARSIDSEEDARFPYRYSDNGRVLHVSVAIAKTSKGFKSLLTYCRFRWPYCTKIMFNRKKHQKISVYNFKNFLRKAGC